MKAKLLTLGLTIAVLFSGFFIFKKEPLSPIDSERRPAQEAIDWGEFLRTEAGKYYAGSQWNPAKVFTKLKENTTWQGGAWQCLELLKGFSLVQSSGRSRRKLLDKPSDHSFTFNFEISDQDYQGSRIGQNHYELAAKMRTDLDGTNPGFWDNQDWQKWDGYQTSSEKWHALQYRSRTVFNPGGSPRSLQRVLVLREVDTGDEKFDQWIQFTVHPADSSETNRTPSEDKPFNPVGKGLQRLVDFISVRHKDSNPIPGERLKENGEYEKPVLSFRQYWRDGRGFNPKDRLTSIGDADRCYSCHANGMRQVSPYPSSIWNKPLARTSSNPAEAKTQSEVLEYFDAKMEGYGQISWAESITPEFYGPPLGRKVGCASCHNNWESGSVAELSRGAINWGFSAGHAIHKMSEDATMPMNDRGAHGLARKFVRDLVSGNKNEGITGDTKRQIHHRWLKGPGARSGSYPSYLQAITDIKNINLGVDENIKNQRIEQALAAANIAEKSNKDYRDYLFRGNSYSQIYRRQTRDWLLGSCDQEVSPQSLINQEELFQEMAPAPVPPNSQLSNSATTQ